MKVYWMIGVIVSVCVAVTWIWFRMRRKHDNEGEIVVPGDVWTPPGPGADGETTEPSKPTEEDTDSSLWSEPLNESSTSSAVSDPNSQPNEELGSDPFAESGTEQAGSDPNSPTLPMDGFETMWEYFTRILKMEKGGKVYQYLKTIYIFVCEDYLADEPTIYNEKNFPVIIEYYGDEHNDYVFRQMLAWLFALTLEELRPDLRYELLYAGYTIANEQQPTFGWTFDSDPNVARVVAEVYWAVTRQEDEIAALMEELGGCPIAYQNDISELFPDITAFMPPAPGPYLSEYQNRPKGYPTGAEAGDHTLHEDNMVHDALCEYYSLNTSDKEKRQATIQAIADKEHKKPHLFGGPRSVTDPQYGKMSFNPVFGVHNLGIEIPDDGAIADLAYTVGMISSNSRKPLLNQEYGRRRPGEGAIDGQANADPNQRVLVNFAIEDGDGHKTGYYNKDGDYVDDQGNHIGDYVTYYQNAVFANSYPSGHSAYISGVATMLCIVMPDRAPQVMQAANRFALSRTLTHYHWLSDTKHGLVIGGIMPPVLFSVTNINLREMIRKAQQEYSKLKRKYA